MESFLRYAVYALPEPGDLAERLTAWLGWDIVTGTFVDQPQIAGLDVSGLTQTPRRYGAHATLKPPFRLAQGGSLQDLEAAVSQLSALLTPVSLPALKVAQVGRFLALVPASPSEHMAQLAARVVADLDAFRAALTPEELETRRKPGLTPGQDVLLQRWGYPFVREAFRFHITLTGSLEEGGAAPVQAALERYLSPVLNGPFQVSSLCLVGEDDKGLFHLIRRVPMTA
ncbi:DUF1045 domain-containing protein [Aliiroseovarius subalbicans]|uniref:DUF1045 domain-containing protein n=1 Tax=Aliiroseovarius subalbicans TaxID=2925840 RepID=UPI001F573BCE|nr:DUF1045 domain-containing protein [Aliiroseovarius subalbicans]MCI2399926.1 DUF1045 domain-containing protein [Aliiroseovarius subalbicans]